MLRCKLNSLGFGDGSGPEIWRWCRTRVVSMIPSFRQSKVVRTAPATMPREQAQTIKLDMFVS